MVGGRAVVGGRWSVIVGRTCDRCGWSGCGRSSGGGRAVVGVCSVVGGRSSLLRHIPCCRVSGVDSAAEFGFQQPGEVGGGRGGGEEGI